VTAADVLGVQVSDTEWAGRRGGEAAGFVDSPGFVELCDGAKVALRRSNNDETIARFTEETTLFLRAARLP